MESSYRQVIFFPNSILEQNVRILRKHILFCDLINLGNVYDINKLSLVEEWNDNKSFSLIYEMHFSYQIILYKHSKVSLNNIIDIGTCYIKRLKINISNLDKC